VQKDDAVGGSEQGLARPLNHGVHGVSAAQRDADDALLLLRRGRAVGGGAPQESHRINNIRTTRCLPTTLNLTPQEREASHIHAFFMTSTLYNKTANVKYDVIFISLHVGVFNVRRANVKYDVISISLHVGVFNVRRANVKYDVISISLHVGVFNVRRTNVKYDVISISLHVLLVYVTCFVPDFICSSAHEVRCTLLQQRPHCLHRERI